jgi:hypothetical protein
MVPDRHVKDLEQHLMRGGKMTEPIYDSMPLTSDNPAVAHTVDGKLTITEPRTQPDGTPVFEKAPCFGKPADAGKYRPKPGT